ncbi:MAG: recombinase family protein [Clostridiales bacterium]|jgi:DNA invertase Pin-like site-specific DNA recombinase|nr:recombinase family protein [Clostridiales bacterium]MDR1439332.1 recombinase family protein [Clostridiales bacterium]
MDNRIDALYGRQSVDKKDSISIESQLEFCKFETRGEAYKEYTDKGYSGKNTARPDFQNLIRDIKAGLIKRAIVYKLDRISRSIIDFANMMALFQQHGVEFVSCQEKFDTSTPMGRAMLNICIVFAQLERETIQMRVTDAYYSRCVKGFKMGGKTPYGFRTEPFVMNGIKTKRLVPAEDELDVIRLMFEMYEKPKTSFGDIARHFVERGLSIFKGDLTRSAISQLLRNPVYVQADLDVYEFFKSQGAVIESEVEGFTGLNACYLYRGRDVEEDKRKSLKGQHLVLAPHEGAVSSDVWLRVRRKLMANKGLQTGRKAVNTWLAGTIKCGNCGHALVHRGMGGYSYLRCHMRLDNKSCEGCGTIHEPEMEQFVFKAMAQRLSEFRTLNGGDPAKANPKLAALKVDLARVEGEIEKLLDTLSGANPTLLAYANKKIEALDDERQTLAKQIADLSADTVSPERVIQISRYLDDWENVGFDDRRHVVSGMISIIRATSKNVDIEWKI